VSEYRDQPHACPSCAAPLREYRNRLCCDACGGMFLAVADLRRSVDEMVRVEPEITFDDDETSERSCPSCHAPMMTCRVQFAFSDMLARPRVRVERCDRDGVWFAGGNLAKALTEVERVMGGGGVPGRSGPPRGGGFGGFNP
jgi:hypothetical protein